MSKNSELKDYLRQVVLDNCLRIVATYFPLNLSDFSDSIRNSSASADDISDIVGVIYHAVRDRADELRKSGESGDDAENMAAVEILENSLYRLMIDQGSLEAIMDCELFDAYISGEADEDDDDDCDGEVLMA